METNLNWFGSKTTKQILTTFHFSFCLWGHGLFDLLFFRQIEFPRCPTLWSDKFVRYVHFSEFPSFQISGFLTIIFLQIYGSSELLTLSFFEISEFLRPPPLVRIFHCKFLWISRFLSFCISEFPTLLFSLGFRVSEDTVRQCSSCFQISEFLSHYSLPPHTHTHLNFVPWTLSLCNNFQVSEFSKLQIFEYFLLCHFQKFQVHVLAWPQAISQMQNK